MLLMACFLSPNVTFDHELIRRKYNIFVFNAMNLLQFDCETATINLSDQALRLVFVSESFTWCYRASALT